MYKKKSSLAKCAKNEAALARSPENTVFFLLISALHIWRWDTLLKRRFAFPLISGGVRAAEVPLLGVTNFPKHAQGSSLSGGFKYCDRQVKMSRLSP